MTVIRHEFPENSGLIALLKPLAEGAMKSAKMHPEKWWPVRMNNYPVENLSENTVILVIENTNRRKVEFFAGYVDGNFTYDVVETSYDNPPRTVDGGFYLLLP